VKMHPGLGRTTNPLSGRGAGGRTNRCANVRNPRSLHPCPQFHPQGAQGYPRAAARPTRIGRIAPRLRARREAAFRPCSWSPPRLPPSLITDQTRKACQRLGREAQHMHTIAPRLPRRRLAAGRERRVLSAPVGGPALRCSRRRRSQRSLASSFPPFLSLHPKATGRAHCGR